MRSRQNYRFKFLIAEKQIKLPLFIFMLVYSKHCTTFTLKSEFKFKYRIPVACQALKKSSKNQLSTRMNQCKKIWLISLILLLAAEINAQSVKPPVTSKLPRVIILTTGGTIAGKGKSATEAAYTAGMLKTHDLLSAVPEIQQKAEINDEVIANIGSQDMSIDIWLKLAKRINEIFEKKDADAVVITHGTDTQESTAYFLSLTVKYDHPVVLVGAMRPATAMSADGNRNLLDAVTVAADPQSQGRGVMVVMNELIFTARDVTKTSTSSTGAFQSRNFGPVGLLYDGKISYYYKPERKSGSKSPFDITGRTTLPQVEIAYGYADASKDAVCAFIENKVAGIVYAGVGNGNINRANMHVLKEAAQKGILVCRAARVGSGRVTLHNEVNDAACRFIVADDLSPQKARILLMLALTKTETDPKLQLQNMQQLFFEY